MKKLILVGVLAGAMMFSLCACGGEETNTTAPADNQSAVQETAEENAETPEVEAGVEKDLPEGDYEEVGDGTLYLVNQSGTTENGDEIIVYPDMNSIPFAYVDYQLWDLDGSVQTYIYLDGTEIDKQQIGEGYQGSLFLDSEWQVSEGVHKVETVQYADNDPANEITFYRSETYTVKAN